mmetsp:Transcript_4482/g.6717  ORF Transcript_4482/g.6717 Transcript_4482/m.6717 type:complete len:163 (+) Transcript_4482:55-543(+)|eukprot:CAMPEP_0201548576 /NCGR_PEP_ID=MMETSP0173_2-20130828/5110_1 /ASSEMBLY_ACC=CAM_ASM_000268 /TAXON_ID=218659 /ORGANISM="Vexillifera sp., Strain DIVA3 564/2" /LENGTH=162 /DNA_ID=CAMNT_0047958005 /DNA_START=61 /DNA_END=549 /DNA_ORIENTATION=+
MADGPKLDGNKWIIEKVDGKQDIVVNATETKQSVLISNCSNFVVTVKGKVSSITINKCSTGGVIFDDVIASVELMNGKKIQLQANGAVPTIQVDKTEGATVFLQTEAGQKADIISSLASEVNVVLPAADDNSDPSELPIPYQFKTNVKDGKLVTAPVDHVGV